MECESTMKYKPGHMGSFHYDRIHLFILIIFTQEFSIYLACPWNTINRSTVRLTLSECPLPICRVILSNYSAIAILELYGIVHIWDNRLAQAAKSCTFASCIYLYNNFNEFNDTVKRLLNIISVSELLKVSKVRPF